MDALLHSSLWAMRLDPGDLGRTEVGSQGSMGMSNVCGAHLVCFLSLDLRDAHQEWSLFQFCFGSVVLELEITQTKTRKDHTNLHDKGSYACSQEFGTREP